MASSLLMLQYNVEPPPKVTSLNVGPYLGREIIGRYLLGYDCIDIVAKDRIDSDVRKIVKSTASSLAGLEIVEETSFKNFLANSNAAAIWVYS